MIILVGTTSVLLLDSNPKRKRYTIQMQATQVDAANTGRVHIGKGYQPVATVGHNAQGEVLIQSAITEEYKEFEGDHKPYKGPIWAIASAASQSLIIEEITEDSPL